LDLRRKPNEPGVSQQNYEINEFMCTWWRVPTVDKPCLADFFHALLGMKADLIPEGFCHCQSTQILTGKG
jgi:hypothetical protein